ncbi:metallophosphoesterase family protein [Litchfieldella rifensis]|uniref:Metallophosphoesterase family protein n=1 Tax=Litchfieldella rifensis TaxID=762643 RepID=A0ABV7LS43_9GAMM
MTLDHSVVARGRHCPLAYRYDPTDVSAAPESSVADVLYVIGGLYGNPVALETIEAMAEVERSEGRRVELIFNGDFHWFDTDPAIFWALNDRVMRHTALLGNVEFELVDTHPGAGCGCVYPDHVDDGVVERSNRIMARLQGVAAECHEQVAELRKLPRYRCLELAGQRVAIVHGDPESLAGWGLALEALRDHAHHATLQHWFERMGVSVIAGTHTCLPTLWHEGERAIINNGSAGMGNLRDDSRGLISRIAVDSSHPDALVRSRAGALTVELLPVAFDIEAWQALFSRWWPDGSDAALSYGKRIRGGTRLDIEQAHLDLDTSR